MIILSILCCTIPERQDIFVRLLRRLQAQWVGMEITHPTLGEIEIITDGTESFLNGGKSIGAKRGDLVGRARGKYLCFLDDDEDIAPNYVETLVRLCHNDADVVTFRNLTKTDYYWTIIDMSLQFNNEEATPDRIVKRSPWHVCPVKSEYAKKYEFKDINYGEDWDWFSKVLTHCKTEAKTNQILHCYNHSSIKSESDKIIKAGYV